jgi:hypothetical protein
MTNYGNALLFVRDAGYGNALLFVRDAGGRAGARACEGRGGTPLEPAPYVYIGTPTGLHSHYSLSRVYPLFQGVEQSPCSQVTWTLELGVAADR